MASNNEKENELEELEEDYYAILNLSKGSTDKEITQAYHRFGRIYHPDRHKTAESKKNAEILFSKIKKVYDVLSDPHTRAIYDSVGVKGLKQDGWQVMTRTKTPKEIREEYERLAKEAEEKRLRELTNSDGEFSMAINATSLFDRYTTSEDMLGEIRLGDFAMTQSLNIPLTNKDTAAVSVSMNSDDDRSKGALVTTFRRVLSADTWIQANVLLGSASGFELKGFKRLTQRCSGTLSGLFTFGNGNVLSNYVATVGYQLSKNINGRVIYRHGKNSRMKTTVEYTQNDYKFSVSTQLSLVNTYISCEVARTFKNHNLTINSSAKYGYLGFMFDYGVRKKVTEFTDLSATMIVGSKVGVLLNLRVDRASQAFVFPIHLSQEIVPSAVFYGSLAPLACYYVLKKLFIDPYLKDQEEKESKETQEKLRSELLEKRRQAMSAQDLMKEVYDRSVDREGQNGLIIKNAFYGKLPLQARTTTNETESVINVTVPLQVLVNNHSLQILTDSSKSDLQGFYDPCIGQPKSLYIEYKFNEELHEATFSDNDIIRIPKKSHRISV